MDKFKKYLPQFTTKTHFVNKFSHTYLTNYTKMNINSTEYQH